MLGTIIRTVGLVGVAVLLAAGCSSSKKIDVGTPCVLNSDCNNPLSCTFGKCHEGCKSNVDCHSGEKCTKVIDLGVCLSSVESNCTAVNPVCETPLACASDLQCRSTCAMVTDCLGLQVCVSGVCAEPADLVNGQLPQKRTSIDGGAGIDSSGGGISGGRDAGSDVPLTSPGDAAVGIDGAGGTAGTAAGGAGGRSGVGGQTGNSCPSPQTQFGFVAQGDSNPNFQAGLGVRTADELLIFNGYLGPDPMPAADAGSAPKVPYVYVQAFDPGNGKSKGPAIPLFKAADQIAPGSISLGTAAIAPTGEIILIFTAIDSSAYATVAYATFAAFLSKSTTDAGVGGLQIVRIVQVEVKQLNSQPDCIWSVASKAFVCSWRYDAGAPWAVKVRKFLPDGRSAGGDTDNVPTDRTDSYTGGDGEVGVSGNLFGVGYLRQAYNTPQLTVMDKLGNQVGSYVALNPGGSGWVTVAGTSAGFVTFYDSTGVASTLVPVDSSGNVAATGVDAGVLQGFHFAGTKAASFGRAINDDVGGQGGVGLALLYDDGVAFAYVSADGLTHVGPGTVISHSRNGADYMNITNFAGSFGVSLYSATAHSTQMAATGCTP